MYTRISVRLKGWEIGSAMVESPRVDYTALLEVAQGLRRIVEELQNAGFLQNQDVPVFPEMPFDLYGGADSSSSEHPLLSDAKTRAVLEDREDSFITLLKKRGIASGMDAGRAVMIFLLSALLMKALQAMQPNKYRTQRRLSSIFCMTIKLTVRLMKSPACLRRWGTTWNMPRISRLE